MIPAHLSLFSTLLLVPALFLLLSLFHPPPTTSALTVHLVCHTHDDVGWLKTFEQYYLGMNNSLQQAGVQYILDSTIAALLANPARKFIYAEQAFFSRWYNYQTDATKAQVRRLVAQRRLEFVNGGWCMHDEATPHYIDMIDQTTLGHQFILQEFGEAANPRVGWQIDPFGHSATHASLLTAQVGLDATFFTKYDYQDHTIRRNTRELELIWRPSPALGTSGQVWTGTFPNLGDYGPPPSLCFDYFCQDTRNDPVQADRALEDYNLDTKVRAFLEYANIQANVTKGDRATMNIMWYLGSDFEYENANEWFESLDVLIDAVNAMGTDVKVNYSTPSLYTYARNKEGLTWNVKKDDFFPYGISDHAYRTGFYTSRPALKRYVRVLSHWLQVARHLEVFTAGNGTGTRALWEAMGVVQHHDAVSGTERQHVAYNYAYLLAKGSVSAFATAQSAISTLTSNPSAPQAPFTICPALNVSLCPPTQSSVLQAVVLYNSLSKNVTTTLQLPSNSSSVILYDADGVQLLQTQYDVLPAFPTQATPAGAAPYNVFVQADVPAMGWTTLFYQAGHAAEDGEHRHERARAGANGERGVGATPDQAWDVGFNNATGELEVIIDNVNNRTYNVRQQFLYYRSMQDNGQNSGAYIFRPAEQSTWPATTAVINNSISSNNSLITSVYQAINPWISQTIRLSSASPFIEFEWTIGPIDVSDEQGKEVITRFTLTNFNNNATWYTDSNGREFQTRVRNHRDTYPWVPSEPTAGNYFPVTTSVWMKDANSALVINVDRCEGASSLVDGQLEVMLHRRTLRSDDGNTVEALNETDAIAPDGRTRIGRGLVVTGSFLLSIVPPADAARTARTGHQAQYAPLIPFFTPITNVGQYRSTHITQWSFMASALPHQIELITMQPFTDGRVLFRLAHIYGAGDDAVLSLPASVNLLTLFKRQVVDVVELSLSANSAAGSHVPLQWNTNEGDEDVEERSTRKSVKETFDGVTVTLSPMEVRTFAVRFAAQQ